MQTSKKHKKWLMIVLVWAFFTAGVLLCRTLFLQSSVTELFNYKIKQMEKAGENIDMVFVGASRTYRSFDPAIFDEVLNINNTMNNGCPSQRPSFSYYLLKQILDSNDVKYVVVGATYNGMIFNQGVHDLSFGVDRLNAINKLTCAINLYGVNKGLQAVTGKTEYLEDMIPSAVKENLELKKYTKKGINIESADAYVNNGYKGTYLPVESGSICFNMDNAKTEFKASDSIPEQREYFDKIVSMCKSKGIQVFLVSGPCSMMNLYNINHYQDAVDFYADYAKKEGVHYYNMNFLKNREKLFPDDRFIDRLHVNYDGGQIASKYLAQIIKEELEGKDTSQYFYKDFEELKKDVHRIPSCAAKAYRTGDKIVVKGASYHNEGIMPQYRVLGYVKDLDKYVRLTKWENKDNFIFDTESLSRFTHVRIEARIGEKDEKPAFAKASLKRCFENEQ